MSTFMFQLCQSCQRHIKANRCPFCGSTAVAPVARKPLDAARSSRSQLLGAVAVAGAFTVSACSDDTTYTPFYGAPGDEGTSSSSSGGSSGLDGTPSPDASTTSSSGSGTDAGEVGDAGDTDAGETGDAAASDAEAPDAE